MSVSASVGGRRTPGGITCGHQNVGLHGNLFTAWLVLRKGGSRERGLGGLATEREEGKTAEESASRGE
jgi:hypothetical protein